MRITITGGAGFIGANLSKHLLGLGAQVTIIDDLSSGSLSNIADLDVEFIQGSMLDPNTSAFDSCDAIVHLGAVPSVPRSVNDPVTSHEANATGTLMVLEAARKRNAHVIVASSSSVYGANPTLPKSEDMRPMPISPYAVSKLTTESYAISYQHCYELPTLAFRFFNVFGPLQAPGHAYAAVVPSFTHAALTGDPIPIHGDGTQTRDFTYVGTVVATIIDALERRVTSLDPINLAFGSRYSLLDVIALLEDQLGHPLERQHQPMRPGDVKDSQADSSRLIQLFPDISPVPLNIGLAQTVDWMRTFISKDEE
ncbi:MAG: NAD-dependent epimerase/dehydratase family protein [Marmoricola sp.]